MDNFKTIYSILRYLEEAMDYDEPDMSFVSAEKLKISDQRWIAIMEMLEKSGYVEGISIKRSIRGSVVLSECNPRITLKGLEYLKESSLMKKAENIAKGIAEIVDAVR